MFTSRRDVIIGAPHFTYISLILINIHGFSVGFNYNDKTMHMSSVTSQNGSERTSTSRTHFSCRQHAMRAGVRLLNLTAKVGMPRDTDVCYSPEGRSSNLHLPFIYLKGTKPRDASP